jgi:hypothetical protein
MTKFFFVITSDKYVLQTLQPNEFLITVIKLLFEPLQRVHTTHTSGQHSVPERFIETSDTAKFLMG